MCKYCLCFTAGVASLKNHLTITVAGIYILYILFLLFYLKAGPNNFEIHIFWLSFCQKYFMA